MTDWKRAIEEEWNRRAPERAPDRLFPLISMGFDAREIVAAVDVLLSGRLTMNEKVRQFESEFASTVGASHAVMVNSGSSGLLLAMAAASNPLRANHLRSGDEVLVPAVCWPTSLWPIVQCGLKPVFVDVDPQTLNADIDDVRRKINGKTRAMVAVHILGNSAPMSLLLEIVKEHRLLLIEDSCESLGSRALGGYLGTFGEFGVYSFYYSHHITTGEGGMVVCKTAADCDLLRCLRSHGWSRNASNRKEIEEANRDVDPRFLFTNLGYNVRPLEVQAAFGLCQIKRLAQMNEVRSINKASLTRALADHPRWKGQIAFPLASAGTEPSWFGLPCLLRHDLAQHRRKYVEYLTAQGVENRPIVSGNFTRQPALKAANIHAEPRDFPGAETINERGFFIGLHTEPVPQSMIHRLANILLGFDF